MVLAADRGPWTSGGGASVETVTDQVSSPDGGTFSPTQRLNQLSRDAIQALNSPNHGGVGNGEGQNCLFQDGHAEFVQSAFKGVDNDNIFTHLDLSGSPDSMTVGDGPLPNVDSPGEDSLGSDRHSSTDSFVYP